MFKIDFLKNQGLPAKNRSLEIGIFAGIAAVSLLVFLLLCTQYFHNTTDLSAKKKALTLHEKILDEINGEGSLKSDIKKKLATYESCNLEIANSIGRYVQWTPVLREFVSALPESMLLNELSVIRTIEKKKVKSIFDAKKIVNFEIISRILKSDVFEPNAEGAAVEKYLSDLRNSKSLNEVLNETYIVESNDAEYKESNGRVHKGKNHITHSMLKSQEIAGAQ